jgi:hypothetical protein
VSHVNNRNHRGPSRPSDPPRESGRRLLTLPRGEGVELRVCHDSFKGYPYVSLREWERGGGGHMHPTRRGCTVRRGELRQLLDALADLDLDAPSPVAEPEPEPDRVGTAHHPRPSGHVVPPWEDLPPVDPQIYAFI